MVTNLTLALQKEKKSFTKVRIQKILDYVARQSKRTDTEKETNFQQLTEEQELWIRHRMNGPDWRWTRWDGIEEVWTPWNSMGEPINLWQELRTKWALQ